MIQIRLTAEGDEDGVVRLLNSNFPHVGMTRARLEERMEDGALFLVAVSDGAVVGFLEMVFRNSAFIRGMAVKEGFRRKGVGAALIKEACSQAGISGRMKIRVKASKSNSAAVKLYEASGFFVKTESLDAFGAPVLVMEKRLAN